ncbi:MAG: transglutaminase domain-containing protein [Deltaproteobacteria bacterium]|nr:transglutaminase domain-containing protein [Deltaproteobacteria bacterium]
MSLSTQTTQSFRGHLSLGVAHELGVALVCCSAILLVILGGSFPILAWGVFGAPILAAGLSMRRVAAPALSGTLIALAALGTAIAQVVSRGIDALVFGGGILLLGLLAARLLTKRTLEHDVQALALSLLLVLAGSVLNMRLSFAPVFVVYAIGFVWALSTRQLLLGGHRAAVERGESEKKADFRLRDRRDVVGIPFLLATSSVALIVLFSTLVIFFTFPRIGWGNLGFMGQQGGRFPGQVSLRGLPRGGLGSRELVARVVGVRKDQWAKGLYLRGGVYDQLNAQGFSRREKPIWGTPEQSELAQDKDRIRYEIFLAPLAGDLLFSLGDVRFSHTVSGGSSNPTVPTYVDGVSRRGELKATRALRSALKYSVVGGLSSASELPPVVEDGPHLDLDDKHAPWLQTPEVRQEVLVLLEKITKGAKNDDEVVSRIRDYLMDNFSYTLDQPSGLKKDPLSAFLLEDRAGHCEYFATAFALLLRLKGIPARVIGGYQGGFYDEEDEVVVFTTRNAHAWVEWFRDGAGWAVDDATPVSGSPGEILEGALAWLERMQRFWDDTIVDYSLTNQVDALKGARASLGDPDALKRAFMWGLGGSLIILAIVLAIWRFRRRRGRNKSPEHILSVALVKTIEGLLNEPVDINQTHREAVQKTIAVLDKTNQRELENILRAFEGHRFSKRSLDVKDVHILVKALKLIRPKSS